MSRECFGDELSDWLWDGEDIYALSFCTDELMLNFRSILQVEFVASELDHTCEHFRRATLVLGRGKIVQRGSTNCVEVYKNILRLMARSSSK